ncbi:MAG: hypothetical protein DRI61_02850 [Chloroflexi bacterium]|nr:MAG: hypothetical protein DRI61_02850 [Chloroflexota bacterium]HDN79989.1 hypothetical protein [Chloroflexota bacterium]
MERKLERYIPIEEAARKYNLPVGLLTKLVEAGKIKAVKFGVDGEEMTGVAERDVIRVAGQRISRDQVAHLRGKPIRLNQAVKKYGLNRSSLWKWARQGRINVLRDEEGVLELDEADVAYIALLKKMGAVQQGRAILLPSS